jgi:hypothetical protein
LNTSGNILTSTFCKLLTSADKTIAQCGANDPIFCVSQTGTHDAPGLSGSTVYAANTGQNQPIQVFVNGDVCPLSSNASGAGWTRGDYLRSDSSGYGMTGAVGIDNIGAVALESVTGGQTGLVQVVLLERGASGTSYQIVTANTTLTVANIGGIVSANTASTITITLPPVATLTPGDRLRITQQQAPAAGAGLTVAINGADTGTVTMYGNGFTAAAGKGAVNTQATARAGDAIEVVFDGTNWGIVSVLGTWARQP